MARVIVEMEFILSAAVIRSAPVILQNWNHYILAVDLRFPCFPWYRFMSDNDVWRVLQRLVDSYILVIRDEKENKPICKKIRIQQPEGAIYTVS